VEKSKPNGRSFKILFYKTAILLFISRNEQKINPHQEEINLILSFGSNVETWTLEDFESFFSDVDLLFEDVLPHEFYKHKDVLDKIAKVTGRCVVKFPKLQEEKIRNNDALKKVFEEMYGLAGSIGVMVGENQHTNPENKFPLIVNSLREQISALCGQLIKLSTAALVFVSIIQADLDPNVNHSLNINKEKSIFSHIKSDN
jgi:hypothetical protein